VNLSTILNRQQRLYGGTVAGVATSHRRTFLQRQGWRCSGRDGVGDSGDGRTGLMATEVTGPANLASRRCSCTGAAQLFTFPSRAPPSFLEGAACWPYGSGCHSATGLLLTMPHSVAQWRGWPRHKSWRSSAGA
jgi:hypothetical protein